MRLPLMLVLSFMIHTSLIADSAEQPCCCSKLPPRFPQKVVKPTEGMVLIPGGTFTMGNDSDVARKDEKPAHKVKVNDFWLDVTPVTNKQFKAFVDATGYVTTAEKAPTLQEIMSQVPPGTPPPPPELLVASSLVFKPTSGPVSLKNHFIWWDWVAGADWKHPTGPNSTIVDKEEHPVVQISWDDAVAYAKWAGKRLPTEAEWEYAAYGGKENITYVWGNEDFSEEKPQANIWQGEFPYKCSKPNGDYGTTPVKTFPANPYGLYDMSGNVWQWCSDKYHIGYYSQLKSQELAVNPQGPEKSLDPEEPYATKHVHRGGSFLCHKSYCAGYRITARMKTCPDTSLNHLGFRCARSVEGVKEGQ